jgi:DNA repair exonuclease SbcCD ATPase subunit
MTQQMTIKLSNGITISYDWETTPLEDLPEQAAFFIDQVKEIEKDCELLILQQNIQKLRRQLEDLEKERKILIKMKADVLEEITAILEKGTEMTVNYLKELGLKETYIEQTQNKLEQTQQKIKRIYPDYHGEF